MKTLPTLALLTALAACHAPASAPARRTLEPSGLEQVSLLAKGME